MHHAVCIMQRTSCPGSQQTEGKILPGQVFIWLQKPLKGHWLRGRQREVGKCIQVRWFLWSREWSAGCTQRYYSFIANVWLLSSFLRPVDKFGVLFNSHYPPQWYLSDRNPTVLLRLCYAWAMHYATAYWYYILAAFLARVMQKEILLAHLSAPRLHMSLDSSCAVTPVSMLCNSPSWLLQSPLLHATFPTVKVTFWCCQAFLLCMVPFQLWKSHYIKRGHSGTGVAPARVMLVQQMVWSWRALTNNCSSVGS